MDGWLSGLRLRVASAVDALRPEGSNPSPSVGRPGLACHAAGAPPEYYGKEAWTVALWLGGDVAYLNLAAAESEDDPDIWTDDSLLNEHGLLLDFGGNGRLVGIEFLNLSVLPRNHEALEYFADLGCAKSASQGFSEGASSDET